MNIIKEIKTTVEAELNGTIDLLTVAEYEQAKDIIPKSWAEYWLKDDGETEGFHTCYKPTLHFTDDIIEQRAIATKANVRPVIRFSDETLAVADTFDLAKTKWTVILPGVALANAAVGKCQWVNIQAWLDAWKLRAKLDA
jgi:hypothetical protein